MRTVLLALAAGSLWAACSGISRQRQEMEPRSDITEVVRRSDRAVAESHTLSGLVELEHGLNDFIHSEGRIPKRLDELVPKYLAGIPLVSLDITEHRDTRSVQYYPSEVIVDGQINGAALQDTGSWGYAYNQGEKRVIVFVDCTHKTSGGQLWYQTRGAY